MRLPARCAVFGLLLAATALGALGAQTPRIAPPPPCRPDAIGTAVASLLARPTSRTLPRIAVLQPEARISDDAQAHVAWALADRVTARLREMPRVFVETTGSTDRAWAEAGGRPDRLARNLGAAFIVTGLVAADRDGARVTVRLVSATDSALWQGDFVYPGLSLAAIEDEVVGAVARELRIDPSPRDAAAGNAEAYDALARGDYFLAGHEASSPDSARASYERALRAAPESPRLMARLARAYAVALERGERTGPLRRDMAIREALALVDRALPADSSLADAWTSRAMLLRVRDPVQYRGAVAAHERAVRLAPRSAEGHHQFAVTLLRLGRDDAARAQVRDALSVERDRASSLTLLAELEYLARRNGASCALLNASIAADSYDPLAYALRARVRMRLGERRDAFSDAETAARLSGADWGEALQFYVTAVGRESDAVQADARRIARSRLKQGVSMSVRESAFLGMAYAAAGDRDRAFDALSRSGPAGAELRTALRDPAFDRIRSDPRFRRVGMAASARSSEGGTVPAAASPAPVRP